MVENWKHGHGKYNLIAYTVMPNHCHVLIHRENVQPGGLVRSWKSYTAKTLNHLITEAGLQKAVGFGQIDSLETKNIFNALIIFIRTQ